MKRTLAPTSPHMKGPDVRYAQRLLRKSPLVDMRPRLDGDYGPVMMAAVRRAKFLLGYPASKVDEAFGDVLESYLRRDAGRKALPLANRARRKARLAAEKKKRKLLGPATIAEAKRWIGTKEHPFGSNIAPPFTTWYHLVGAWCAMFVSYCLYRVGSKHARAGARWSYVPNMVWDARHHQNGLVALGRADVIAWRREGRPVVIAYDWTHNGEADHTGFFDEWARSGWDFYAVEGNTGIGNDSNGGEVMRRLRSVSQVQAFIGVTG